MGSSKPVEGRAPCPRSDVTCSAREAIDLDHLWADGILKSTYLRGLDLRHALIYTKVATSLLIVYSRASMVDCAHFKLCRL